MRPVLLAVSFYYPEIARGLCLGARTVLEDAEIDFIQTEVPGALEFPVVLTMAKNLDRFAGAIALGCVVRGETTHYDLITQTCFSKLQDVACDPPWPLGVGILTCENLTQAKARSALGKNNKGAQAAKACLSLLSFAQRLRQSSDA